MVHVTAIVCAIVLAWGLAYGGKNIGTGLLGIAQVLKEHYGKNTKR